MHVLHTSEGRRGEITVTVYCRFFGEAEQKNGQRGEVSADFELSLGKMNTRLDNTKMRMHYSTKFDTKFLS
jgi:hypothetical protein